MNNDQCTGTPNKSIEKYGYTNSEFLNLTIKDIRPQEDVDNLMEDLQKSRPSLQQSGDWRHTLKNGQVIDVQITSHTLEFIGRPCHINVSFSSSLRMESWFLEFSHNNYDN